MAKFKGRPGWGTPANLEALMRAGFEYPEEGFEGYDQGCCPVCHNSGERTMEDVIDDDDEIGYECIQCEAGWTEIRQSVGYKGLHVIEDMYDNSYHVQNIRRKDTT